MKKLLPLFFAVISACLSYSQNVLTVNDNGDDGSGTLRSLIAYANPGDTIEFTGSVDTIYLTSGELLINKPLNIIGDSVSIIRDTINTSLRFRIIHVDLQNESDSVFLQGLHIHYGATPDSAYVKPGGGISIDQGTVVMHDCSVENNKAGDGSYYNNVTGNGGNGGGIFNSGNLIILNCEIKNNHTGKGAGGYTPDHDARNGGNGGGIYNNGFLSIEESDVDSNSTGAGGNCGSEYHESAVAGDAGKGGAVYNAGDMIILKSSFGYNYTDHGGNASSDMHGYGGNGGDGGAIYNLGTCNLSLSVMSNNMTGEGGSGYGYISGSSSGNGGNGGAIYNSGTCNIYQSFLTHNLTSNGKGASAGYIADAGNGGDGGAIYNSGTCNSSLSFMSSNLTGKGGSAACSAGGAVSRAGFGGNGGAVYNSGTCTFSLSYLSGNLTGDGASANSGESATAGSGGIGGAIDNSGICKISLSNLFGNLTGDGGLAAGGSYYNLSGDGGSGGAVDNTGPLTMITSLVAGNKTGEGPLPDETISGNGGGICSENSTSWLVNCTIANNSCKNENDTENIVRRNSLGGGIIAMSGEVRLDNTIVALNNSDSYPDGDDLGGNITAFYSLIQYLPEGNLTGHNNLTGVDPAFLADTNYRLSANSPAINAGNPDTTGLNLPPVDLDSLPRIFAGNIDIGAYEYQVPGPPVIVVSVDTLNFNDCVVFHFCVDSFNIINSGIDLLILDSITSTGAFSLLETDSNFVQILTGLEVVGKHDLTVYVRFYPEEVKHYNGVISIYSNDTVNPVISIPVTGNGLSDYGVPHENKPDLSYINVYPVPADKRIFVSSLSPVRSYELINVNGMIVKRDACTVGNEFYINVSGLKHNIYILKLLLDDVIVYRKVLIR